MLSIWCVELRQWPYPDVIHPQMTNHCHLPSSSPDLCLTASWLPRCVPGDFPESLGHRGKQKDPAGCLSPPTPGSFYMYTQAHARTQVYICTHVHMYTNTCKHTHTSTCTYKHKYMHTLIHAYTHIHTLSHMWYILRKFWMISA